MTDFDIPSGYGVPLINQSSLLFSPAVMDALAAALAGTADPGEDGRTPELQANATHIQWRYIGDPAWIDLVALEDLKGDPGAPGADLTEFVYANFAAFEAERTTKKGRVNSSNWGTTLSISALNNVSGDAFVETIMTSRLGIPGLTQYLTIADTGGTGNTYNQRLWRKINNVGGTETLTAWQYATRVPTPVDNAQAAPKSYVDAKGLSNITWTQLEALNNANTQRGYVQDTGFNLGTATGISKYNGWYGGQMDYVAHAFYAGGDRLVQVQDVWVSNLDGTVDQIRRWRAQAPVTFAWSAWTAWTIQMPPAGGPTLIPAATAQATIDAITTTGEYYMELPTGVASWGAYINDSIYNGYTSGTAILRTTATFQGASLTQSQHLYIAEPSATSGTIQAWRRRFNGGAWSAWNSKLRVGTPVGNGDAVPKSYADNLLTFAAVGSWTDTAAFDAETGDTKMGAIANGISDLGAYTGLSAYNGVFVGIPAVEHYSSFKSGIGTQYVQRIKFADPTTHAMVTIQRAKVGFAGTWSAWAVV